MLPEFPPNAWQAGRCSTEATHMVSKMESKKKSSDVREGQGVPEQDERMFEKASQSERDKAYDHFARYISRRKSSKRSDRRTLMLEKRKEVDVWIARAIKEKAGIAKDKMNELLKEYREKKISQELYTLKRDAIRDEYITAIRNIEIRGQIECRTKQPFKPHGATLAIEKKRHLKVMK